MADQANKNDNGVSGNCIEEIEQIQMMEVEEIMPPIDLGTGSTSSSTTSTSAGDYNAVLAMLTSRVNLKVEHTSSFVLDCPIPSIPMLEGRAYQVTWDGSFEDMLRPPGPQVVAGNGANGNGGQDENLQPTPPNSQNCQQADTGNPGFWQNICSIFGRAASNDNGIGNASHYNGDPPSPVGGDDSPSGIPTSPPGLLFKDCGGLEKQINFIKSAVFGPLREADQYKRFGLIPPKGILFYGPPGTGKTRLAQAISNELTQTMGKPVHFIYRKGNDVAAKHFGQSSANLREVFAEAIEMKPTVLFFDELDGLCPSRNKVHLSETYVTIVTTILGLMDELPQGEVFVIGASNRMDSIDPALLRPGRFDKHLEFLPPSQQGRFDILGIHTDQWKAQPAVNILAHLAARTVGFSGADLSKLCLDAFDNCLSRVVNELEDISDDATEDSWMKVDLAPLEVREEDWHSALEKMKPSSAAVFGSTLFTPSTIVARHIEPLLKTNITQLTNKALEYLPRGFIGSCSSQEIPSLYIWSSSKSVFANMEEYIISPLFQFDDVLCDIPKYCLSCDSLLSAPWQDWPKKVEGAFSQAVNCPQPSILYIPNVEEFWQTLSGGRYGEARASQLQTHLESLRGSQVLLVTTASRHPADLERESPFRLISCPHKRTFQVVPPTEEERNALFTQLLKESLEARQGDWTTQDKEALAFMKGKFVEVTKGLGIGLIASIYDTLKTQLSSLSIVTPKDVMGALANALASHEVQLAAIRCGQCGGYDCSGTNNIPDNGQVLEIGSALGTVMMNHLEESAILDGRNSKL